MIFWQTRIETTLVGNEACQKRERLIESLYNSESPTFLPPRRPRTLLKGMSRGLGGIHPQKVGFLCWGIFLNNNY